MNYVKKPMIPAHAVMAEKDYNLEEKTMKKIKSVFEWD